VLLNDL